MCIQTNLKETIEERKSKSRTVKDKGRLVCVRQIVQVRKVSKKKKNEQAMR